MILRIIALSVILLCAGEAFANNYVIPNYYRNRRFLNSYSAVGWSDRKEVGLTHSIENTDAKNSGAKFSDEEEMRLRPHLYYRTPVNLNVEAAIVSSKEENKALPSGSKTKEEGMEYHLGLGYELTEAPVAFALILESAKNDLTSANGTKTDQTNFEGSLGAGYRLPNQMYLGAGYTNSRMKTKGTKEDLRDRYMLGLGQVYGDRANPDAAAELIMLFSNKDSAQTYVALLQSLINAGDLQYNGALTFTRLDGALSVSGYGLKAGVDYKFYDFYVGPQAAYNWLKVKTNGVESKGTEIEPSLEAGYRVAFLEAFLRYDISKNENKINNNLGKVEREGNVLTANVTYKF